MYLLVFVTLVVALTGVYAQIISLQATRLFANQTTVAQALLAWHSTAISQAHNGVTTVPGLAGCDLTVGGPVGTVCQNGANNITVQPSTILPPGGMQACSGGVASNCWTALPVGYNPNPYTFYSIFYQPAAGQDYVVTFVPPPVTGAKNPPPGFITLPNGALASPQIGYTLSDLFRQLKNSGISPISYGMIIGGQITTSSFSNGVNASNFQYALPIVLTGPAYNGSVAVISTP